MTQSQPREARPGPKAVESIGRVPPHDPTTEEALLSAMLMEPSAAVEGSSLVPPQAYYVVGHSHIAAAIAAVIAGGELVDVHSVQAELRRAGTLDVLQAADAKGAAALVCLAARPGMTTRVAHYARLVNDAATARALAARADTLAEAAWSQDLDHAARVVEDASEILRVGGRRGLRADSFEADLIGFDQLEERPLPEYLVDRILVENTVAGLFGRRGTGKSFLALDLSAHIASGSWWQGRSVKAGPVLYLAAEGVGGLPKRVAAWKTHHRIYQVPNLVVYPQAVNLLDPRAVEVVVEVAGRRGFALVVVDTVARSIPGGDENGPRDMGILVEHADQIRRASDACVLLVHHSGKDPALGMRGHSALEAAVDTVLEVKGDDQNLQLSCTKQKDDAEFPVIRLGLSVVEVTVAGASTTSCVVTGQTADNWVPDSRLDQAREVLVQLMSSTPATGTDVRDAIMDRLGVQKTAAYLIMNRLVSDGFMTNTGTNKRTLYVLARQA